MENKRVLVFLVWLMAIMLVASVLMINIIGHPPTHPVLNYSSKDGGITLTATCPNRTKLVADSTYTEMTDRWLNSTCARDNDSASTAFRTITILYMSNVQSDTEGIQIRSEGTISPAP